MAAELLHINLIPSELRKAAPTSIEQFSRTPLVALVVVVLVALPILILLPKQLQQHQLNQLNQKIQALEPKRQEIERAQQTIQRLRSQQAAFQGLKKGQGIWAKRLNTLSNVTPEGVWLTEFSLDSSKGLVIQGSAIASSGPAMASVTRLAQDLKSDPEFSSVFKQINIESMKQRQDGDFDIVDFTVTCTLPGATGAL